MLDRILHSPFSSGLEAPAVLAILIALETILSADNAIALAAIAQGLEDSRKQGQALNLGLAVAYILRMTLILTATWVVKYWQFQVLGAAYLLWLVWQYFTSDKGEEANHHGPKFTSLWQVIPVIAVTDMAFSLDSVTAAIAVSQETWLVLTGGTIGVIALRFMAQLFIRWLNEYDRLQDAAYVTVGLVGIRLLLRAIKPELVPPEWIAALIVASIFAWGFSRRNAGAASLEEEDSLPTSQVPKES
jgi:YkoY family integral membrane protein